MTLHFLRSTFVLFLVLALAPPAAAQTSHYVAPPNWQGAGTGDGTQANPWRSIGDALNAAGPGDTLLLMDGSYGRLERTSGINSTPEAPVTIRSLNGKGAHFESIFLQGVDNVTLRNLSVWPVSNPPASRFVDARGNNTTIDGLDVRSREDALTAMYGWTATEWSATARDGIATWGANSRILNSRAVGTSAALTIVGRDSQMIGNQVIGHLADAMRALGDNSLVKGNRTRDAFAVGGNHDDGFQSWSQNGIVPVTGLTLDGNIIIGWAHPDRDHPLRSWNLQGIGLFDGWYDDLTITNNIVAVTMFHGITVMGVRGALIANNTTLTLDYRPGDGGPRGRNSPIAVFNSKAGNPSTNIIVANNAAMAFNSNVAPDQITWISNTTYSDPALVFEDAAGFDFRPRANSGMIGAADPAHAPPADVFGNARPQGNGPDRGAIELGGAGGGQETPVEEPAQPEQPPAEEGGTGSGGTPDGGSTGEGSGDTGGTDGGTGTAPSPGPKFEKPPKKDNPNKGKKADRQALKAEKAARRAARQAAKAEARAARSAAPVVSTRAPVLSGVFQESAGFWR